MPEEIALGLTDPSLSPGGRVCPAPLTAAPMISTHPSVILRSKSHAHLPTHALWYVSMGMLSYLTLKRPP